MKHATIPDVALSLMKARSRIERGWCQGSYGDREDLSCARSALNHELSFERYHAAARYLHSALPDTWLSSVIAYNDSPDTTKGDILALYDRAIALALSE